MSYAVARPASLWLRVFLPFAAGYYLSYLLRTVNAVIAPDLTRELALSASDLGLLTSVYFLAFGAVQIPLGMLLDRYGPRRVEATLLLVCAAGAAFFGLARDLGQLSVARALIGLGVSACLMAGLKSFHQWFPRERQPALLGAIMVAGTLGALSATLPLEALLPALGWRGVFLALAAVSAGAALLIWSVPEHGQEIASEGLARQLAGVAQVFGSRHFWRYAPQSCLVVGGFMALQGLWAGPWLMTVSALPRTDAAAHLFYMNFALVAGYLAIAAFSTRAFARGLRPGVLLGAGSALTVLVGALILAEAGPTPVLWSLFGFFVCAVNLSYPLVTSHFPPALAGRVNTALNLLAFAGAFGVQWGFGALVDALGAAGTDRVHSFRLAFAALLCVQAVSVAWYAYSARRG